MIEMYLNNSAENGKTATIYRVDIYDIAYKRHCKPLDE